MNITEKRKIEAVVKRRAERAIMQIREQMVDRVANLEENPPFTATQKKAVAAYERARVAETKAHEAYRVAGDKTRNASLAIENTLLEGQSVGRYGADKIIVDYRVRNIRDYLENPRNKNFPQNRPEWSVDSELEALWNSVQEIEEWTDEQIQIAIYLGDDDTAKELLETLTVQLQHITEG